MSYSTATANDETNGVERAASFYETEIRETFTQTVRQVPYTRLSVPYVKERRLAQMALIEAVGDMVSYGKPRAALMQVIASSNCPLVAVLRDAIAQDYIEGNLDWIAEHAA